MSTVSTNYISSFWKTKENDWSRAIVEHNDEHSWITLAGWCTLTKKGASKALFFPVSGSSGKLPEDSECLTRWFPR